MLRGKKILVTAGPTREPIDPVRFLSNRSTGKMGFHIAEILAEKGAEVYLVAGPVELQIKNKKIHRIDVETAFQMYESCINIFPQCDCAVMAAAVADFTPKEFKPYKIKKEKELEIFYLQLTKTKDILIQLGHIKKVNQLLVGFSLEISDELENAIKKLKSKNLDFIVLNSLNDEGAGFSTDTNKITIINKEGEIIPYPLKSKKKVAEDIVNYLIKYLTHS